MDAASIIAITSIVSSSLVALVGVLIPQILTMRKAAVDRTISHRNWWRDKRLDLYTDILTFCAESALSITNRQDELALVKLEGRVGTSGSLEVAEYFGQYVEALRANRAPEMNAAWIKLRSHIPIEVWELSKGSGNY